MAGQTAGTSGGDWFKWVSSAFKNSADSGGSGGSAQSYSIGSLGSLYGDSASKEANSAAHLRSAQITYSADNVANAIGQYGGSFGQGFSYGYQGAKMTVAPFLAYRQAKAQKKIYGMQRDLAEMTAQAYQTAAEDVIRASHNQVAALTFSTGQAKASTRVSQAASGVRVGGTGSAAEVLASQDITRDFQVNQLLANGITQSFGYQRQKVQAKSDALAYELARSSISPWATAICATFSSMSSVGSFSGGGGSGSGGGAGSFKQAPGN